MASVDLSSQYQRLVRFFWDPEPVNDGHCIDTIWCLGESYDPISGQPRSIAPDQDAQDPDPDAVDNEPVIVLSNQPAPAPEAGGGEQEAAAAPSAALATAADKGWPAPFLDDFESRFWFTYRSHFPSIERSTDGGSSTSLTMAVRLRSHLVDQSGFTSDAGFGCMIRSGQSLLANAMAMLRLGRDWRRGAQVREERQLVSLFADDPRAPFSLHRFIAHGASNCGKNPGEWFGPSAAARCIEALSDQYEPSGLRVYVTGDGGDVYQDQLRQRAQTSGHGFTPVLILLGIRLGIERVTPVYREALARSLQMPQSVGIAGGRPSASHYFVGNQGDWFFYLDPHQTRPRLPYHENSGDLSDDDVASCHTRRLRRLHVEQMDPSMLIAFLLKNQEDWEDWSARINSSTGTALLRIAETQPAPFGDGSGDDALDKVDALDEEDEHDDGEMVSLPS